MPIPLSAPAYSSTNPEADKEADDYKDYLDIEDISDESPESVEYVVPTPPLKGYQYLKVIQKLFKLILVSVTNIQL